MNQDWDLSQMRESYEAGELNESDFPPRPIPAFQAWLADAVEQKSDSANGMTLATIDEHGQPQARTLLLKGVNEQGFRFYTNYESSKAKEMERHPQASLLFYWDFMERQVRVEGTVQKIDQKDSEAYFATRPRDSQIGAWASPQSQILSSRAELEKRQQEFEERFEGGDIPCPPHWGGYDLKPTKVEFWQGRKGRLHDRLVYTLHGDEWKMTRLAP